MIGTATVGGKTGPNQAIVAQAIANVSKVEYDIAGAVVRFTYAPTGMAPRTIEVDMQNLATATITLSAGVSLAFLTT